MLFSIDTVKNVLRNGVITISSFIYPPYCTYCRAYLSSRCVLCQKCIALIQPLVSEKIKVTKKYCITVYAIGNYKEPLRSLILAKSRSDIVAAQQVGKLIWDMTYIKNREIDYLIPIPLHWTRYAWRGFNQAYEMARIVSKKSGIPIACLLHRHKKTVFQSLVKGHEREKNVCDAFVIKSTNQSLYKNKHLLLVDDLMTTGATLQAAAKQLIKLQPASITAVVGSRVL